MECMHEQGTIYYETYGDGRPMLVLHGGYLDHRHMVSAIEPLFEQRAGWGCGGTRKIIRLFELPLPAADAQTFCH